MYFFTCLYRRRYAACLVGKRIHPCISELVKTFTNFDLHSFMKIISQPKPLSSIDFFTAFVLYFFKITCRYMHGYQSTFTNCRTPFYSALQVSYAAFNIL